MKQSHYWGASSRPASQDLPSQKIVTLNRVLNQTNQMYILTSNSQALFLAIIRKTKSNTDGWYSCKKNQTRKSTHSFILACGPRSNTRFSSLNN